MIREVVSTYFNFFKLSQYSHVDFVRRPGFLVYQGFHAIHQRLVANSSGISHLANQIRNHAGVVGTA